MDYFDRIDEKMLELATKEQRKMYEAVKKANGSCAQAAKDLGCGACVPNASLKRLIETAARKGYSPKHGLNEPYPEGYHAGKITIQRSSTGEIERTWERMCADNEKQLDLLRSAVQAICEDVPPVEPTECPPLNECDKDLMVNIPIGDAHIGMLAWAEECGESYDLKIAEGIHKQAIDMLLLSAPKAETCTIIDLGDFLHADNLMGVTARSGHNLDMDGRYHKVVRAAIRISLHYINSALKKFPKVIYRPEVGNHNDVGAIWMQELLAVHYENEPRVTIGNSAGSVYYWQHGKCFFGSHHAIPLKGKSYPI